MKQRSKLNFSEEISVRTKVNANLTVTITVMNHTTMDTMVGIFDFKDLIKSKPLDTKDEVAQEESTSSGETAEVSEGAKPSEVEAHD